MTASTLNLCLAAAAAAAALVAGATGVHAADHEAGVPLNPSEAAGAWTVSSNGQDLCRVTLGADHAAKAEALCRDAIPGAPATWQATSDGVEFLGKDGHELIAFHRWSNSLFVSHRSSGEDLQLRRGG
ncbi:AprI/Inh family metalloprotease inhibitor [Phenylobacterium sp.]|uniref:AprI/Inh family metalloprotease inhibitor n=1 Tax=Phenylobacterium sp. TaxID=1871053 RepID=UPI0011FFA448|nr:AprI/Inh family metalloprotease inhibitor [Phenylobacterium sp.]THD57765.1 MAG: hypothetical protein E8A49_21395 [Phenylobacterium sp.]